MLYDISTCWSRKKINIKLGGGLVPLIVSFSENPNVNNMYFSNVFSLFMK